MGILSQRPLAVSAAPLTANKPSAMMVMILKLKSRHKWDDVSRFETASLQLQLMLKVLHLQGGRCKVKKIKESINIH